MLIPAASKADFKAFQRQAEYDADELGVRLMGAKEHALDLLQRVASTQRDPSEVLERKVRLEKMSLFQAR
jgi:Zn-dependent protease with chaperone function